MKLLGIIITFITLLTISTNVIAGDWEEFKKRGHRSPKWTPLVEAGFSAFESGNYETGIDFFKRAIAKGCKDGLIYFKLGEYYEEIENLPSAKNYFELARKNLPKRYPRNEATKTIHEHLGRVLFSMGDMAGAKAEFGKAIKSQGENFTLMFFLGSIARQENNDQKVIDYYDRALRHAPPKGTNPQDIVVTLLIEIGKSYFNLGQYDKSLKIWDRVLEIAPNHPIARQHKTHIQGTMMDKSKKSDENW